MTCTTRHLPQRLIAFESSHALEGGMPGCNRAPSCLGNPTGCGGNAIAVCFERLRRG
jgi:hypothetical protein